MSEFAEVMMNELYWALAAGFAVALVAYLVLYPYAPPDDFENMMQLPRPLDPYFKVERGIVIDGEMRVVTWISPDRTFFRYRKFYPWEYLTRFGEFM